MRLPGVTKWVLLALLGLALAGGVAFAASRLASQQIGIASESISAGNQLAPSVHSVAAEPRKSGPARGETHRGGETTPATAHEATTPSESPSGDDNGHEGPDD